MWLLLILGIFIAVIFGKNGVDAMKGCVTMIFGVMPLIVGSAIIWTGFTRWPGHSKTHWNVRALKGAQCPSAV